MDYLHLSEGMEVLRKVYEEKKLIFEGGETVVQALGIEEVPCI